MSGRDTETALSVTGLDGCAAGWVAVTLSASVIRPAHRGGHRRDAHQS